MSWGSPAEVDATIATSLPLWGERMTENWYAEEKTQSVKSGEDGRKGYHRRDPHRYNSVLPKKKNRSVNGKQLT